MPQLTPPQIIKEALDAIDAVFVTHCGSAAFHPTQKEMLVQNAQDQHDIGKIPTLQIMNGVVERQGHTMIIPIPKLSGAPNT